MITPRSMLLPFLILVSLIQTDPGVAAPKKEVLSSAELFKKTSPSVVLLMNSESLGSGSIISATDILTNWHVVESDKRVLVAFKPRQDGAPLDPDEFVVGDIIKKLPGKDLALVRVKRIPSYIQPLQLGMPDEVEIGADVHAIGHPSGEIWTYTKGVISQVRKDFAWSAGPGASFSADVIQTQTPINPGNSGGPLLSGTGRIVGVNSFKARDAEGLNFAVSLSELLRFLKDIPPASKGGKKSPKGSRRAPTEEKGSKGKPRVRELLFQGRDDTDSGYLRIYSSATSDAEQFYYYPDDQAMPVFCFRTSGDKTEAVAMDLDRDGKWDYSVIDTDNNGKFDSMGLHPDGKLNPSSIVSLSDKKLPPYVMDSLPKSVPEPGVEVAASPSFDCTKADTVLQQTVCASDALADLDVTIAALYARVLKKWTAMRDQIKAGQEEWLRGNAAICTGDAIATCLEERYKQRVIYLNILMIE